MHEVYKRWKEEGGRREKEGHSHIGMDGYWWGSKWSGAMSTERK